MTTTIAYRETAHGGPFDTRNASITVNCRSSSIPAKTSTSIERSNGRNGVEAASRARSHVDIHRGGSSIDIGRGAGSIDVGRGRSSVDTVGRARSSVDVSRGRSSVEVFNRSGLYSNHLRPALIDATGKPPVSYRRSVDGSPNGSPKPRLIVTNGRNQLRVVASNIPVHSAHPRATRSPNPGDDRGRSSASGHVRGSHRGVSARGRSPNPDGNGNGNLHRGKATDHGSNGSTSSTNSTGSTSSTSSTGSTSSTKSTNSTNSTGSTNSTSSASSAGSTSTSHSTSTTGSTGTSVSTGSISTDTGTGKSAIPTPRRVEVPPRVRSRSLSASNVAADLKKAPSPSPPGANTTTHEARRSPHTYAQGYGSSPRTANNASKPSTAPDGPPPPPLPPLPSQPSPSRPSSQQQVRPQGLQQTHRRRNSASPSTPTPGPYGYDVNHLTVPPRLSKPRVAGPRAPSVAANHHSHTSPMPSYFGAPPELYPMREQSSMDFVTAMRTDRRISSSTLSVGGVKGGPIRAAPAGGAKLPRTPFPGLSAPTADPVKNRDVLPATMLLNRPRKLSSSSNVSASSGLSSGRESLSSGVSFETRMRAASWSSQTSFESEVGSWTASNYRSGAASRLRPRVKKAPGEQFAILPGEVLELILDELKKLHLADKSDSCATCWMRDLCNVSLTARKWFKFARTALYEDIQLTGADSMHQKKRYKLAYGTRLVLLRRTLRANAQIGAIVHNLKVPAIPAGVSTEEYHNLVASIVMACPNLERLVGLHPTYNHQFSRLFHALSTRRRLKEMTWVVDRVGLPPVFRPQHRARSSSGNAVSMMVPRSKASAPNLRAQASRDQLQEGVVSAGPGGMGGSSMGAHGELQPQQCAAFLDYHINWTYLTTLSVHCLPGAALAPETLVTRAISCLPALQNLYLSHLSSAAFNDNNLLALPPLRKLSLSHLPGVSSSGLSALATGAASQSIRMLTLRHTNLDSLATLARILSNFTKLDTFALVQGFPPTLPEDMLIWLMPYLASNTLRKLHWDLTSHPHCANVADSILARSISAGGFPALRTLRAPNDPEGIFQTLCRPQDRADCPADRFRNQGHGLGSGSMSFGAATFSMNRPNTPSSPTTKFPASKSPSSPMFAPEVHAHMHLINHRAVTDLHLARVAAQARLEAAKRIPRFFVNVVDEDGVLAEKYGIAGFLGTVESNIHYHLLPDPGASDDGGGIADVADVLGDGGESISAKGACSGKWNMSLVAADKKDRDRWWHTERGRWKAIEMA